MAESEEVAKLAEAVRRPSDVFVWDIAFVEIFEGDKGGFDIVVGNPPYVRQENIADPLLPREKITIASKKEYKAKLARSVYQLFPRFFGYKAGKDTVARQARRQERPLRLLLFPRTFAAEPEGSVLLHHVQLLARRWLREGFAGVLAKHSHVKLVLDNQSKRSFASADVNTVIVLFSSANDRKERGLTQVARFVNVQGIF